MNRNALRELIEERKRATGRSFAEIAHIGGDGISRAAVHRLASKPTSRLPDPETIEALAKGLDVDPMVVLRAAGASVGIVAEEVEIPTDTHSRVIVAGLGAMTEEERAQVAEMVKGLLGETGQDTGANQ